MCMQCMQPRLVRLINSLVGFTGRAPHMFADVQGNAQPTRWMVSWCQLSQGFKLGQGWCVRASFVNLFRAVARSRPGVVAAGRGVFLADVDRDHMCG